MLHSIKKTLKSIRMKIYNELYSHIKWWWQRRTRGFDNRELWNLDMTIAGYITPRLKAFKEISVKHTICPGTMHYNYYGKMCVEANEEDEETLNEHWANVLDIMIEGFECVQKDNYPYDIKLEKPLNNALCLFHKYYFDLWD